MLIIGGGIAGPVLALFLRRAGLSPEIYEAGVGTSDVGGAIGIAPNGMNVLAAAGVAEQVRDVSVTASEVLFENQAGKRLACSPGARNRYGQTGVMITRAALHRVLVERAIAEGIPVHYRKAFTGLDDTAGQPVRVSFADGSHAMGDFVVGADGIRSAVRQATLPNAPAPVYTGMVAPGGFSPCLDVDVTPRSHQKMHFIFGQKGFFGYFPTLTPDGPKTLWWSTASAPLPERNQSSVNSMAALKQRLLELHGDWAHPVPQLIQSATQMMDIAIHDVPSLPAWSEGRTILIGDAAHAVAPHSGQGASLALEDAQLLAKLLRDSQSNSLEHIFREFEQERRPRTDKVIALGRRNGQRKEEMPPIAYRIQQLMIRLFVPLTRARRQDWLLAYKVE